MQISSTDKERISQRLRQAMAKRKHTQYQVFIETGVHQTKVSRVLKCDFKRKTKSINILCNYADSILEDTSIGDEKSKELLVGTVLDLWDGTKSNAQKLMDLLGAVGRISK